MLMLSGRIALIWFLSATALAQQVISIRAGFINFAVGAVYLDDRRIEHPSDQSYEVLDGMSLRTESGLAEIQLGAGAFLRLNQGTVLRMEDASLTNTRVRIDRGSVLIEVIEIYEDNEIHVHFKDAIIQLEREGLYRLDANRSQLRVYGGKAGIRNPHRKASAKRGDSVDFRDLSAVKFDTGRKDAFHLWAAYRSFNHNLQLLKTGWHSSHWVSLLMGWFQNENYGVRLKDKDWEDPALY